MDVIFVTTGKVKMNKGDLKMEKAYVDDLIARDMQDDDVKADMLKEKAQLDLAVNLMQAR